jgi:hypothetical protein
MSFEVFGDGSIPSHMNPATYYEVTGQTVHFEMRAGNPHLKTSLTFS